MGPSATPHDPRHVVRILVAAADGASRASYRSSLELSGWDVVDACTGRDALVHALILRPAGVVTETNLPGIDGYALCEILRRDSVTRSVPIVAVTDESPETPVERAFAAGADAVLKKPVSTEQLRSEVQRLIDAAEGGFLTHTPPPPARRPSQVKAYLRSETTTPPMAPPDLICPFCDRCLSYVSSYVGGVSERHAEQWDTYVCPAACGRFEYRQRTRALRRVG